MLNAAQAVRPALASHLPTTPGPTHSADEMINLLNDARNHHSGSPLQQHNSALKKLGERKIHSHNVGKTLLKGLKKGAIGFGSWLVWVVDRVPAAIGYVALCCLAS